MKRFWFWIRLLISLGLIVFLLITVDLGDLTSHLAGSHWGFLLLALLIALGDRVLMAYKWNILLRVKGIHIPLVKITSTYLVSTFLGLFLPATVGADALRTFALAREGHTTKDVLSSIVVERLLGIIALLVFVVGAILLSVFVFSQSFFSQIWSLFWIVLVILVGLSGLILLSVNRALWSRTALLAGRWQAGGRTRKIMEKLKEVYLSYAAYRDQQGTLLVFLLLSFVENLFPIFWNYFLALAFSIEVPLLYFFILVPIVLVLVRLPISIDGIGIQEGAFVYFLGLIGLPHPQALLLGIASHVLAILSVLPGGVLYGLGGLQLNIRKAKGFDVSTQPAAAENEPVLDKEEEPA